MSESLREEFQQDMLDVCDRAKRECSYDAKLFRSMVYARGGVDTAKALLKGPRVQSGFETLWMHGRLDISMEARILKPRYAELFKTDELSEARKRLEAADYDVRKCYDL